MRTIEWCPPTGGLLQWTDDAIDTGIEKGRTVGPDGMLELCVEWTAAGSEVLRLPALLQHLRVVQVEGV